MKVTVTAAVLALVFVGAVHAQVDHLECFKIRDSMHRARYTTQLDGVAPPHGCVVRAPAKLMCLPTAQPELVPSPPGAPAGRSTGGFLCYKIRCRRGSTSALNVSDRFGVRVVRPRRSRLLCAPIPGSNNAAETCEATTTTTLTDGGTTSTTLESDGSTTTTLAHGSTTTTSVTPQPTTTTIFPSCSAPATACGSCGDGACKPIRPTGELVCTFQEPGFCQGECNSGADCPAGKFCVGGAGDARCCTPCF